MSACRGKHAVADGDASLQRRRVASVDPVYLAGRWWRLV
jgi:hypothetical protein